MPKASRESASEFVEVPGYEGHFERFAGGFTVGFERYTEDPDLTPFYAGLPDDRCQCGHWGYVITGMVTFKSSSGEETIEAGEAYYVPPGHTPVLHAGTEVVEFSPTEELARTMEVVTTNMTTPGADAR